MEQTKVTAPERDEPSSTSKTTNSNYIPWLVVAFLLLLIISMWISYHEGYVAGENCAVHAVNSLTGGFC